ncbi:hypothetical protein DSO57_1009674 [Entomophthora muscae]|uniref:Uncharacterized protein n=1 Tax=Entomophthora muscae TaxID=34485 RepID=A0ACC2SVL5_9FUNG|nr:hypothetical protein DSO57_1009674 [Entomophthora muscae]
MVHYLHQCGDIFRPPNTGSNPCPVSNYPGHLEAPANNNKSPPKPDITKVVCHRYNHTGKSQCGVEEELSTSTQSTNILPDLLFTPDTRFLGNVLHQVLVDDVHMVQTHSKVQASQEATKEVSKPYSCQLLDNVPDTEPQHLGDTTPLRGIIVAIPMETMKDHHPELCDSIVKHLSTANNLDFHLVNNIGSSYSESTYADIFVNKFKVQAIMTLGSL